MANGYYNSIPPGFHLKIQENPALAGQSKYDALQMGDTLYVRNMYQVFFAFGPDFDKAVEDCMNFALQKIHHKIDTQ